jgi:hypothetical protein
VAPAAVHADGNDAIHIVPDLRNQPAEFTETRSALVEKLALRTDPAGRERRGGSATRSTIGRWSIAAPSSPPIGCGSAAMASMAAGQAHRSA